jgi:hypothetical protein
MSYYEALRQLRRVGAGKAEGDALLVMTCEALALAHAINPALAYKGAKKRGLTATQVRQLAPISLGDLMFA